jgi:hypothetical protein
MEIEGPAALYGRANGQWKTSEPLATWSNAALNVPKLMANGRAVRWNPGTLRLGGFKPGTLGSHTDIFATESHALARIDDVKANRSCFILVNLATYASPATGVLQLHTQGPPMTGPINGQAKEEPLNP